MLLTLDRGKADYDEIQNELHEPDAGKRLTLDGGKADYDEI